MIKTYELLSAGQTIGVFQFESAGMREAIKKAEAGCDRRSDSLRFVI